VSTVALRGFLSLRKLSINSELLITVIGIVLIQKLDNITFGFLFHVLLVYRSVLKRFFQQFCLIIQMINFLFNVTSESPRLRHERITTVKLFTVFIFTQTTHVDIRQSKSEIRDNSANQKQQRTGNPRNDSETASTGRRATILAVQFVPHTTHHQDTCRPEAEKC